MPFPTSPTNGSTYTSSAGVSYTYNGTAWVIIAGSAGSSSNWTVSGSNIYRNSSVGIGGTASPVAKLDLQSGTAAHPVFALSSGVMDLSVAQMFTRTVGAATTWSFTNVPSGRGVTVVLHLTNGGAFAQTWPNLPTSSVKWPGGTAPALTAAGTDVLVFVTHDGGTTWRGNIFGKDVK